jgi:hypothetical protein
MREGTNSGKIMMTVDDNCKNKNQTQIRRSVVDVS